MRKYFPCGHRGKGLYCHRCLQAEEFEQTAKDEKDVTKKTWLIKAAMSLRLIPSKESQLPS